MLEKVAITPPSTALTYTGERYTSEVSGEVKHEHHHRYLFALQFCDGKSVLDVASGEGFGSALLGRVASQVVGIDVSVEAVRHASANYGSDTVSFSVGDCVDMPISDASVDVVVSFETLEHIADQDRFLSEVKRVLRPGGVLAISTPNVEVCKDIATTPNPFHVKELDEAEFCSSLGVNFSYYRLFGQRSVVGSAIAPGSPELSDADLQQSFRADDNAVYSVVPGIGHPIYFIAVASDAPLPAIRHGLLDDRPFLMGLYALLQGRLEGMLRAEHNARACEALRDAAQEQIAALQFQRMTAQKFRKMLHETQKQLLSLTAELDRAKSELDRAKSELDRTKSELDRTKSELASIYASRSWRLSQPIRLCGRILRALKRRAARQAARLRGRLKLKAQLDILTRSGLFDEQYYLSNNPDVRKAGVLAAAHFLSYGATEGRFPNPLFDPQFYLASYPDVAAAGINPLVHYIEAGAAERRNPGREFDTGFYLDSYPDVAQRGYNPLFHFLRYGAAEGRLPQPPRDAAAVN
jgi:SAM-dependent methyltransferase